MIVEGTARSADGSVRVTVGPGGVLRALEIRADHQLARTVLELAAIATSEAASRARNLLSGELSGLPADALAALGFTDHDAELAERIESTVPPTWRDL